MPIYPSPLTAEGIADVLAGSLISGAWQIELQGVLMDALACDGLVIAEWPEGFGVPKGRSNVASRPMAHGMFPGPAYLEDRTLEWAVAALGASWDDLLDAQSELGRAFAPVPDTDADYVVPLVFTLDDPDTAYRVYGQPARAEWGYTVALAARAATTRFNDLARCQFTAMDPRVYSDTLYSETASLESTTSGGLGFPHAFPHGFGSATSGAAICVNAGNFVTYPVVTVNAGPSGASGVKLLQVATGEEWSITLALAAGDRLVIDMAARTCLLDGTASRAIYINRPPSVWWGLEPGSNYITLNATGAGTTATVEWRHAWLL